MTAKEWVLKSRRIVTPDGIQEGGILIRDGRIAALLSGAQIKRGFRISDAGNSVVMPGVVDTHVHVNEPGRAEWEGFDSATRAAAAGGVTTIVDMPLNSIPATVSAEALRIKAEAARGRIWVDCGFWGGVVPGNVREIESLAAAGVLGFKAFLVPSGVEEFPHVAASDLDAGMPVLARLNLPLLVHAEWVEDASFPAAVDAKTERSRGYDDFLRSRPASWEDRAVKRMAELCGKHKCRVHIVHLSSAGALESVRRARRAGHPMTVETCPHYLTFYAEEIADGRTDFKCCPPIREGSNRERLWDALTNGQIDFIASDHSPCSPAFKKLESGEFCAAWGGIASLQLGLSAVWTEAHRRGRSIEDLTRWLCEGPARFAGLGERKGKIATGYDADLTVWDPEAAFTVSPDRLHHKHKATPYMGRRLEGIVRRTYVRGEPVYADGNFGRGPAGRILLKSDMTEHSAGNG